MKKNDLEITKLFLTLDKETVMVLMRKRFDNVEEYLKILDNLNFKDLELLKQMSNSCNMSGKPFLPTQKLEFIDLIYAYKANGLDTAKIVQMIESGKIDTGELLSDLFIKIMENIGFSKDEIASISKEKLLSWDKRYIHLMAKELQGNLTEATASHRPTQAGEKSFIDIIRATNFTDFKKYISDISNIYGRTNSNTENIFKSLRMDYASWVSPAKDLEISFKSVNASTVELNKVSTEITRYVEALREISAIRGFIDKQYPQCIKNGEFVIPAEIISNKTKLKGFVEGLTKHLEGVKKRAEGNLDNPNPERVNMAERNLTIIANIEMQIATLDSITTESSKEFDITIKMWDRNPQKDLFQGNYSTCCIGMGGGNASAMPHYLLNTAFNMIEMVDNVTGETIGNALCYFVKDSSGKPMLVIDNVEINNSVKIADEGGMKIREKITEYAKAVARSVTGEDDTRIIMGQNFNDIPTSDLTISTENISFLGDMECEDLYLDLYEGDGWVNKKHMAAQIKYFSLN